MSDIGVYGGSSKRNRKWLAIGLLQSGGRKPAPVGVVTDVTVTGTATDLSASWTNPANDDAAEWLIATPYETGTARHDLAVQLPVTATEVSWPTETGSGGPITPGSWNVGVARCNPAGCTKSVLGTSVLVT